MDVVNLENMPLQTCDVGTQWPDNIEHNYSFNCGNKPMKDCGTQTDPTPSVSVSIFACFNETPFGAIVY